VEGGSCGGELLLLVGDATVDIAIFAGLLLFAAADIMGGLCTLHALKLSPVAVVAATGERTFIEWGKSLLSANSSGSNPNRLGGGCG
jgi:hypothetical protein